MNNKALEALIESWKQAARARDRLADEERSKGNIDAALPLENAADAYEHCASSLRDRMGVED